MKISVVLLSGKELLGVLALWWECLRLFYGCVCGGLCWECFLWCVGRFYHGFTSLGICFCVFFCDCFRPRPGFDSLVAGKHFLSVGFRQLGPDGFRYNMLLVVKLKG